MNRFLIIGIIAVISVILGVIAAANNIESKPNLQESQDMPIIEKKPDVRDSVQEQLGLYDENGRPMFTPGPSVKSQLGLP